MTGGGNPLPMTVDNVGFLLDRLGQDCSPLQYLRELTQNAIEAVLRTGEPGQINWDVDWTSYDLGDGPMKVCIVDTGDGMTGDEMIKFINQLSSSGSEQSFTGNYGVGAKIAAATKNPAGVIYQSWKNGEGYMVQLEKNPATGEYGLRQWELKDGTYSHYFPLDDAIKPAEIGAHGTKVILVGAKTSDNTMATPPDAASPSRWISKYLNTRYFQFPSGVTVKAREGWDNPRTDKDRNVLRTITGQKPYLDQHATASGIQSLSGVKVHWWILKDDAAISNNSGFIEFGRSRRGSVSGRTLRPRHRQSRDSRSAALRDPLRQQVRRHLRRAPPGEGRTADYQHGTDDASPQWPTAALGGLGIRVPRKHAEAAR